MTQKRLHWIVGSAVFIITLIVYLMTVQSTVSFWDCGEFIASAVLMQVPHPPGTPFFLILGRVFSMIPFADSLAFRVNMISVMSSVFTVLFLYLVIVKVIENYKNHKYDSLLDAMGTYLAAAIGALSLAFADTFWFNAVEAEVYALSTFFIAIVTYLIMKWNEKADEEDNEKYLIMIAYFLGLSSGVHLMAVLAAVPITMIIMIRKYLDDEEHFKKTGRIFLIHSAVILVIAVIMWFGLTHTSPPGQEAFDSVDRRFLMIFAAVSVLIMGVFWKQIFKRNSFYLPIIFGGIALFSIYPGIVKYVPKFITTIGKDNFTIDILVIALIFVSVGYLIYWTAKERKNTLNLIAKGIFFALLGFTTYTSIPIRSNQDTPINLNSPQTMTELVKYLNREQYGDFPTFQRRFSQEPHQQRIYSEYSSDMDFLFNYQMGHMFNRYLLWNYSGRESTVQDAGVNWNQLYGIPFLIGLLGLFIHFRRDWKMASVFLIMFIFLGWLTAFYQNQQQPQPRERDYFYVGAFFVYSLWIGLGARGIIELIRNYFKDKTFLKPLSTGVLLFLFILIPVNMLFSNYFENDRSRNMVPWDYSYNLLQSAKPNAILFTNGDNDTFPLWYLQDVEGVRRDIRIVNLSLLNTEWYIKQMKNTTPHGANKVPISYSDAQIARIGPSPWEPQNVSINVPRNVFEEFGVKDEKIIESGKISWRMDNTAQFGSTKAIRAQDIMVLDILRTNNWEVPVYFAVTCSEDSRIGLSQYLSFEGLAYRVTPVKYESNLKAIDNKLLRTHLFNEPDGFNKDYQAGFKFRGINDTTIFYNSDHIRLFQNYRNAFFQLAIYYRFEKNDSTSAIEVLDKMEEKIPINNVPIPNYLLFRLANLYLHSGSLEKYKLYSKEVEKNALEQIKQNPLDFNREESPYYILREIYQNLGEWKKLADLFTQLQQYVPNDPNLQRMIDDYRTRAAKDTLEVTKEVIPVE
jgi:hypothetical protein